MNRTFADLKAFGLQYLRSRTGFFFALIFPVILILVFGAIFSNIGTQKINLPVQDLDDSFWSQQYIRILNQTNVFNVEMVSANVNFDEYIKDELLVLALQIPQGFGQAINSSQTANITLKGDPTNSNFNIGVGAANAAAEQLSFIITGGSRLVFVQSENIGSSQFKFIDFFIPGMIAFTALTTPLFSMSAICAEYRSRGFFKLLGSTPLKKSEWLAAKILWYIVLMIASIMVMMLVGMAVFNARLTITPMAIVIVAAGVFLFTSLGMFIGTFVSNPESASAIANAIGFPMMFLSGIFFQLEAMPEYLQVIAKGMPLTYMAQGLRSTMSLGNEVQAAIDLGILLVIGVIFFVIAAKAMSWKGK